MERRKRITHLLIAGTLTALLLTVFLAFRGEGETAAAKTTSVGETAVIAPLPADTTDVAALQAQVEALQAQNAELRAAVGTLQAREAEYRQQIESANQTINELAAQTGGLANGAEGFQPFAGGRSHHGHGASGG